MNPRLRLRRLLALVRARPRNGGRSFRLLSKIPEEWWTTAGSGSVIAWRISIRCRIVASKAPHRPVRGVQARTGISAGTDARSGRVRPALGSVARWVMGLEPPDGDQTCRRVMSGRPHAGDEPAGKPAVSDVWMRRRDCILLHPRDTRFKMDGCKSEIDFCVKVSSHSPAKSFAPGY